MSDYLQQINIKTFRTSMYQNTFHYIYLEKIQALPKRNGAL